MWVGDLLIFLCAVCDWWHNAPQLFWRYNYYTPEDYPAPSSCADVDLVQVLV